MKVQLITTTLLYLFSTSAPYAQDIQWIDQMGNSFETTAYNITTDSQGKVYSCGTFNGSADFDPGPGVQLEVSQGGPDGFIQKLDENGQLIWFRTFGSTGFDIPTSLTIGPDNYLYFTGYFQNSVDFDNQGSGAVLNSFGMEDIFICKMDLDGNLIWAKQIGGANVDQPSDIKTDASGSLYLNGYF